MHRLGMRMPRGSKSKYSPKQRRQAKHIEEGYESRGVGEREAARRAWSTVNKEWGGGTRGGSGSRTMRNKSPSRTGGRKGGRAGGRSTRSSARGSHRRVRR
jgi:plasmid stabilization system protein ParE